jgi:hypothetical protein
MTADQKRLYVLSRIATLHALFLDLARMEEPKHDETNFYYSNLAIELFEVLKHLNFYNYYDQSTMNTLLNNLDIIFGKGQSSTHLFKELSHLAANHSLIKTRTKDEKHTLFCTFMNDAMRVRGEEDVQGFTEIFDFFKESRALWDLETTTGVIQMNLITFLAFFNEAGDIQRALECVEILEPILSRYYFNPEQLRIELKNRENDPVLHKNFKALQLHILKCAENNEIETAISRAQAVSKLKARANAILASVKKYKKIASILIKEKQYPAIEFKASKAVAK